MRFKVGNIWYGVAPLMIELTDADKENIRNMLPSATRYAVFSTRPGIALTYERKTQLSQ